MGKGKIMSKAKAAVGGFANRVQSAADKKQQGRLDMKAQKGANKKGLLDSLTKPLNSIAESWKERGLARQDRKARVGEAKWGAKAEIGEAKNAWKQTLAEQGIDPGQKWADITSQGMGIVGDIVTNEQIDGAESDTKAGLMAANSSGNDSNYNFLMLAALAVLAFLLLKKKRN
jgi:hypothetical protein